jgi:copper oxidase (laccase) domain-containing protein
MNPHFRFLSHNGITLLVYTPWWEQGIVHGMTTNELRFRDEALNADVSRLAQAAGCDHVALLNQTHSDTVQDMRHAERVSSLLESHGDLTKRVEGDAWLFSRESSPAEGALAFGVLTADCVPVVIRGRSGWGVVHAGWRGLANGIIEKAVAALGGAQEAAVFAAAGAPLYEVGLEVISAIGPLAVSYAIPDHDDKVALDTATTAIRQLQAVVPGIAAEKASLCTLADTRFHSFRRDGQQVGRCVTFVASQRIQET